MVQDPVTTPAGPRASDMERYTAARNSVPPATSGTGVPPGTGEGGSA